MHFFNQSWHCDMWTLQHHYHFLVPCVFLSKEHGTEFNSGKSKAPGWRRGRHVQACRLKSRYKEPLSTSWHSSSCHLFSLSGIKTGLKAQDVGCRQLLSFWTCLTAITVWVLAWWICEGIPASSLFPLSPLCFFSSPSPTVCVLSNFTYWENRAESCEPPNLSWLFLSFSFCHLASNHHLKIHPTIKSFSRNLALQSWNARRSRSGWAVQIQSWSVFTPLFLQSVICHGLGMQTQHWRRQVKATSTQNRHQHKQLQQQCK